MHVFITGATGFVGRTITRRLVRDGHLVSVWVRNAAHASTVLGPEVHMVATGDEAASREAVGTADVLVNLAGEPVMGRRWSAEYRLRLEESRVGLTRRLAALVQGSQTRPKVLISASAVGIYGDASAQELTETSPHGSDFLAALCERWEEEALAVRRYGTRVVVLRIGVVLGSEGGVLSELVPLFKLGLGGSVGAGTQYLSWIHVLDLEQIVVHAITDARMEGPINATAPNPIPYREFARQLGAVLHRPTLVTAPAFALKLRFGESAKVLLSSQRVIPERLMSLGFSFAFRDIATALSNLVGTT